MRPGPARSAPPLPANREWPLRRQAWELTCEIITPREEYCQVPGNNEKWRACRLRVVGNSQRDSQRPAGTGRLTERFPRRRRGGFTTAVTRGRPRVAPGDAFLAPDFSSERGRRLGTVVWGSKSPRSPWMP